MRALAVLFAAAAAFSAAAALPAPAEAQRYAPRAPEGHFVVNASACPQLQRVAVNFHRSQPARFSCPRQAWRYVPSRREVRLGVPAPRHNATAQYSRRADSYVMRTRAGAVPVRIVWRAPAPRRAHPHHRAPRRVF
ncbi:hypothetical protein [Alkalicaulis satelles]|uniref:hypothetical protein n=1 Tax=Alkalicaulis satelles TaxID=2609175 RepID=UPI0018EDB157|nr:hypothetical protein [Alkalicaulis satelles]